MRSVCGLSACFKQITALKYNLSCLQMTTCNLKESCVGKIICQETIESSRRGTCLFQCSCITIKINSAMMFAFFKDVKSSAINVKQCWRFIQRREACPLFCFASGRAKACKGKTWYLHPMFPLPELITLIYYLSLIFEVMAIISVCN